MGIGIRLFAAVCEVDGWACGVRGTMNSANDSATARVATTAAGSIRALAKRDKQDAPHTNVDAVKVVEVHDRVEAVDERLRVRVGRYVVCTCVRVCVCVRCLYCVSPPKEVLTPKRTHP